MKEQVNDRKCKHVCDLESENLSVLPSGWNWGNAQVSMDASMPNRF